MSVPTTPSPDHARLGAELYFLLGLFPELRARWEDLFDQSFLALFGAPPGLSPSQERVLLLGAGVRFIRAALPSDRPVSEVRSRSRFASVLAGLEPEPEEALSPETVLPALLARPAEDRLLIAIGVLSGLGVEAASAALDLPESELPVRLRLARIELARQLNARMDERHPGQDDAALQELRVRIEQYLDDALEPDHRERVALHIRQCPVCRAKEQLALELRDALSQLGFRRALHPGLERRIRLAQVAATSAEPAPLLRPISLQQRLRGPMILALALFVSFLGLRALIGLFPSEVDREMAERQRTEEQEARGSFGGGTLAIEALRTGPYPGVLETEGTAQLGEVLVPRVRLESGGRALLLAEPPEGGLVHLAPVSDPASWLDPGEHELEAAGAPVTVSLDQPGEWVLSALVAAAPPEGWPHPRDESVADAKELFGVYEAAGLRVELAQLRVRVVPFLGENP